MENENKKTIVDKSLKVGKDISNLPKDFYQKISKYGITKKSLFSILSIFGCILFIIVLSLASAQFDASQLKKVEYWANFSLIAGVAIFSMISGQAIGDDIQRNNPSGIFMSTLKKYIAIKADLESKNLNIFFDEWLEIYRLRKLDEKIKAILKDNSISQIEVLDLDRNELGKLLSPYKKDWRGTPFEDKYRDVDYTTYFLALNESQLSIIEDIMDGDIKVSKIPKSFFETINNQSAIDMWESSEKSGQKKSLILSANYLYKLSGILAFSLVFTGLAFSAQDKSAMQIIFKIVSYITTLTMAVVWGIFTGIELVKIDTTYLEFKCSILTQYKSEYDEKVFVPISVEDRAKNDYNKLIKEQQNEEVCSNE